jgi:hypothetical protein
MPSNRRLKAALLLIAVFVLVSIYVTSAARQTRSSDFYTRTSDALAQRAEEERDGKALESDESAVHRRLKEAEEAAKKAADKKGAEYHGEEIKSAAENVKANADAGREPVGGRPRKVLKGGATEKILMEGDDKETKKQSPETDEEREAKEEMNYILKRSPSMLPPCTLIRPRSLIQNSHHLLQNILPTLSKSKGYPSPQIQDLAASSRRRA